MLFIFSIGPIASSRGSQLFFSRLNGGFDPVPTGLRAFGRGTSEPRSCSKASHRQNAKVVGETESCWSARNSEFLCNISKLDQARLFRRPARNGGALPRHTTPHNGARRPGRIVAGKEFPSKVETPDVPSVAGRTIMGTLEQLGRGSVRPPRSASQARQPEEKQPMQRVF